MFVSVAQWSRYFMLSWKPKQGGEINSYVCLGKQREQSKLPQYIDFKCENIIVIILICQHKQYGKNDPFFY